MPRARPKKPEVSVTTVDGSAILLMCTTPRMIKKSPRPTEPSSIITSPVGVAPRDTTPPEIRRGPRGEPSSLLVLGRTGGVPGDRMGSHWEPCTLLMVGCTQMA